MALPKQLGVKHRLRTCFIVVCMRAMGKLAQRFGIGGQLWRQLGGQVSPLDGASFSRKLIRSDSQWASSSEEAALNGQATAKKLQL